MNISENERSLRRRVLFNSIPSDTPVTVIQRAIDLLDNEFGSQPDLKFVELVRRLRESIGHEVFQAKNLLGKMVMMRNKPLDQIGPDPADTLSNADADQATAALADGPRERVFNAMLTALAELIAKRGSENLMALKSRLLDEVVNLKLGHECGSRTVAWAKSNSTSSQISGDDQELHKVVNTAFVWMCEKFGPIDADKYLLFAVQKAEQIPEAFDCSPRNFL